MAIQQINSGTAPILWSTVDEAFSKINTNFTELVSTIGEYGVTPIDFTNLGTSVIPDANAVYDLGSSTNRWKDLYLSGASLYIGNAVITSDGTTIQLPEGSTIGGALLDNTYFKYIAVAGQTTMQAATGGEDILSFSGGTGITVTTDETVNTLTITNSGVQSLTAGTGIGVSSSTGAVSVSNTGVTSAVAGTGIGVSSSTGAVTFTNTGVTEIVAEAGSGIIIDNSTGVVSITNAAPNVIQNTFRYIAVPTQPGLIIEADNGSDTFNISEGSGITFNISTGTDTLTINNAGVTNLAASTGISVSGSTGSITITNSGVTSLTAGDGISVSASTGGVTISNTHYGFTSIAVVGQDPVLADNTTDTLVLIAGTGVELVTDPTTDSITISANANLQSNVYGDNSSLLVDSDNNQIVGDINTDQLRTSETSIALGYQAGSVNQNASTVAVGERAGSVNQSQGSIAVGSDAGFSAQGQHGIAIGYVAGYSNQGLRGIAIGSDTGQVNQGIDAIAIGNLAGGANQGQNAIAIGDKAGYSSQPANSIVLNASGVALNGSNAGLYIDPVRQEIGPQVVYYDPSTKEMTYGEVPIGTGGSGGTSDFILYVAGDDSTEYRMMSGEILQFTGAGGITISTDAEGKFTIDSNLNNGLGSGFGFYSPTGYTTVASTGTIEIFGVATSQVYIGGGTGGGTSGNVNLGNGSNTIVFNSATSGIDYDDLTNKPTALQSRTTASGATPIISDGASADLTLTGFKGYFLYKIQTSHAAWVRIYTDTASRTADASRDELTDPDPGSGVIAEVITTGAETILISPGTLGFSNEGTPSTDIPISVKNKSGGGAAITVTLTILQVEV